MSDFQQLLRRDYPNVDGVTVCVSDDTRQNAIKAMDMDTYTARAEEFDESAMLNLSDESQKCLRPITSQPSGSWVLEIGCGDGRFGVYLARAGHQVIETDIAIGSVQKVKSVVEQHSIPNVHFAVVDGEQLPFRDGSIDAVFMVATLHHIPRPDVAIQEIARVLRPGGTLLILHEPASWQYYLFFPLYWLLRRVIRSKSSHAFSMADDKTFGFSRRKLRTLLRGVFEEPMFTPVHYTGKILPNLSILFSKLTGRPAGSHASMTRWAQKIDARIKRIPVLEAFPWDWDIIAKKPHSANIRQKHHANQNDLAGI